MTKKHSLKRSLIASIVVLCLCLTSLIGTTFAWFTDSVTSANNIIKTGTLDVKLEYSVLKDGVWTDYAEVTDATDVFGYNNWEPGYVAVAKFRITTPSFIFAIDSAVLHNKATQISTTTPHIIVVAMISSYP